MSSRIFRPAIFAGLFCCVLSCSKNSSMGESGDKKPIAGCNKVFEYTPAPGQHINSGENEILTPQMASDYAFEQMSNGGSISLGGFGGYLVVGFDTPIQNDGGYNIQVLGNSFETSSEPAIVWVMSDDNDNNKPDDVWYELKGSEFQSGNETRGYKVTYFRPDELRGDVKWLDNEGESGFIFWNQYHKQDCYYPTWIKDDSYTLEGARLSSRISSSNGKIVLEPYEWGYADNFSLIDNQGEIYSDTPGYNHFKISNAVDRDGNEVNLKSISFVKVVNCVNDCVGVLGEISSDISQINDFNLIKNSK